MSEKIASRDEVRHVGDKAQQTLMLAKNYFTTAALCNDAL
jgi:hypothetical protein